LFYCKKDLVELYLRIVVLLFLTNDPLLSYLLIILLVPYYKKVGGFLSVLFLTMVWLRVVEGSFLWRVGCSAIRQAFVLLLSILLRGLVRILTG